MREQEGNAEPHELEIGEAWRAGTARDNHQLGMIVVRRGNGPLRTKQQPGHQRMVMQVPADTRQRVGHGNAGALQFLRIADAGEHQQLRGIEGAGSKNYFGRLDPHQPAAG